MKTNENTTTITTETVNDYNVNHIITVETSVKRNKYTTDDNVAKCTLKIHFDDITLTDIIERAVQPIVINWQGTTRNEHSTKNNRSEFDNVADETLFNTINGKPFTVTVSEIGKRETLTPEQKMLKLIPTLSAEQRAKLIATLTAQ